MVLELLQQNPEIHDHLRSKRVLLTALGFWASRLKASHESWKDRLLRVRPGSDPSQIASEALEFALRELEDSLISPSPSGENGPRSLEAAMAAMALDCRHSGRA
jgi:hypothetical protein